MLVGGVCQAEAGSGGTRLAFGVSPFQRWLTGAGISRILPVGSPVKAGWGYRRRAQGLSPPSRLCPCPKLRWGGPLPHCFPHPRTGKSFFALPLLLQGDSGPSQAPSQYSDDTVRWGREDKGDYHLPQAARLCEQAQLCVMNLAHPYK